MRVRPTYSEEFKSEALALLERSDRSLPVVARDLGVSPCSLRGWYNRQQMSKKKKGRRVPGAAPLPAAVVREESAEERVARLERELAALRKENDTLRMDREILKKAAAFFVKENE
jgi:transposase